MATVVSLPREPISVPESLSSLLPAVEDAIPATSTKVLARFEFESGRGNEGTKVLLIEWEDDVPTSSNHNWKIEWPGKTTVLSARDGAEGSLHRVYFLLAPNATVPARVTLSQGEVTIHVNPLPAIFPPELGVSATTAGKKGVLHTVWAKQRLSVLQKEMDAEMVKNGEGVGLEMVMQEKQWIEENFGVFTKTIQAQPISPTSPRSPVGSRLAEKLKGLKLGTSAQDLAGKPPRNIEPDRKKPNYNELDASKNRAANPLSPDLGDVAVSSFSAFHGTSSPRSARVIIPPSPAQLNNRLNPSRPATRLNSLDAIASGDVQPLEDPGTEDGLFAVKLSPRSPEMTKSPFSFTTSETVPWREKGSDD